MRPRRVELDYQRAPRRPRWPGVVVLAVSLALSAHLTARYRDARHEASRLATESALAAPERRPARAQPPERIEDRMKNAESVVRQLALPWSALIGALERASTSDVALLQLQPDAEQRLLRLTGEARNREAMFAYVRRLSAAEGLAEVHLLSHQVRHAEPQRPIEFSVQAVLR